MQKFTLLIAAVFAVSGVTAQEQKVTQGNGKHNLSSFRTVQQTTNANKGGVPASAAVIFSEDFAAGIPATWQVVDNVASTEVWTYKLGPAGPTIVVGDTLKSVTAANGFAMVDDDSYGATSPANNTDLITPAINCTGNTVVRLAFSDYFRQFAAVASLEVSNDNVTWTSIFDPALGLGQNVASANPRLNDFDISAIAANQATVYIKFHYAGNWDYWWQVDDISVYEPAALDGGVSAITGLASGCGLSATTAITVDITNFGANAISGFPVSYTINGGTPVTESYSATINAGATASYTFIATADFSAPTTFAIAASTGIAGDANAANDGSATSITNVAPNNLSSALTMGFEPGESLADWSVEDGNADGVTWEILAPINTYPRTGTQCMRKPGSGGGVVPEDNDWLFTPCLDLASTSSYSVDVWFKNFDLLPPCQFEVFVGNANNGAAMTQALVQPPVNTDTAYHQATTIFTVATSGTYYIGFHAYMPVGLGGSSSLRIDDINITQIVGINENSIASSVAVYPNPASDVINITSKIQGNVTVELFNSIGQQVYSSNFNQPFKTVVDVSYYAQGVYTVKLSSDNGTVVKKVTVQNN